MDLLTYVHNTISTSVISDPALVMDCVINYQASTFFFVHVGDYAMCSTSHCAASCLVVAGVSQSHHIFMQWDIPYMYL